MPSQPSPFLPSAPGASLVSRAQGADAGLATFARDTPLMLALRGGHAKCAAHLLQLSVRWRLRW